MDNHFLASIPFKPQYKIVYSVGIINSSSAKVYVILMIKCDIFPQRFKVTGTGRFRDQELRCYREPLAKDILIPSKELRKTRDLFSNRSYSVGKRFDVIPRSYYLFSILLGKGCKSVIILCQFDRKSVIARLSLDGSYKSGSTFVEICHYSSCC